MSTQSCFTLTDGTESFSKINHAQYAVAKRLGVDVNNPNFGNIVMVDVKANGIKHFRYDGRYYHATPASGSNDYNRWSITMLQSHDKGAFNIPAINNELLALGNHLGINENDDQIDLIKLLHKTMIGLSSIQYFMFKGKVYRVARTNLHEYDFSSNYNHSQYGIKLIK
ncbi:MAG: hypothetical protein HAW67_05260 [Endozoicomonadaceae bacterium]|nr:hypothetical protein [Endozoicomonadaceae bacterium]